MAFLEGPVPHPRQAGRGPIHVIMVRRWTKLLVGLLIYGLATALMIRSGLGLGPWDAFHLGLSRLVGMSVGMASIVVGLVILCATWFLRVRPGLGTIANMVLIGVFLDLLLPWIPAAGEWLALPYHLTGLVLTGVATGMYIAAELGKGPRDGLMLAVSERTGWSVRRSRTIIEVAVLGLGWWMGGTVGLGTLLFAFGSGPVTQWGLRTFGALPTKPPESLDAAA